MRLLHLEHSEKSKARANPRIQPTGFASLRSARPRLMRHPLAGYWLYGEHQLHEEMNQ